MTRRDQVLRLGIIGCGSIVQASHLPALVRCRAITVTRLVDRDTARAKELAKRFGLGAQVSSDYQDVGTEVDGVLIALPNHLHYPASRYFLEKGVAVLCEKPLAPKLEEAEDLVQMSRRLKVPLAVGMVYRFSQGTQVVKRVLELGLLGDLQGFRLDWGDPGGWKTHSGYEVSSEQAGGGALIVNGIHFIDQMLHWFGPLVKLDYRDDSLGGPEANVAADFVFDWQGQQLKGEMRLSKTSRLKNRLKISGSRASLEMPCGLTAPVTLTSEESKGLRTTIELDTEWGRTGADAFQDQLEDFALAVLGESEPRASGSVSLPSLAVIESCYKNRRSLDRPWEVPIGGPMRAALEASPIRRVLVTGATGFIGGAICEQLSAEEGIEARALIHNTAHAARVRRLPLENVQGDLLAPETSKKALANCDAVIHLAAGSTRAIIEGTKNLLKACVESSVQRFILVSSVRVYGANPGAEAKDESVPPRKTGDPYGDAKLEQERLALKFYERHGLSVVILRAPYVYGPHDHFSQNLISKLKEGKWATIDGGRGILNAVFVYNLLDAIYLGLVSEQGIGKPMFVTDDCPIEWNQCTAEYQRMLGQGSSSLPEVSKAEVEAAREAKGSSGKGAWIISVGKYLSSDSWNRSLARLPLPSSFQRKMMHLFGELMPQLRERLREDPRFREVWLGEGTRAQAVTVDLDDDQLLSQLRQVVHSCGRAKDTLGYRPRFDRKEALRLTELFLAQNGLLGNMFSTSSQSSEESTR